MENEFLTGADIAKILKISKALAYRLMVRGEIPSIRFGRTVRVKREDLDAFVLANSSNRDPDGHTGSTSASLRVH